MECNRDEASRAREIAEKKFMQRDIVGAKKFALKAQILYPGLEGILQMLETLNVYISAEIKVNGEKDWYGVLSVDPMDDHESIRKQYRKLALMFHPDKNKSVGAEGAFKIISEAWSFLSDKWKRSAYDKRRNLNVLQQKASPCNNIGRSVPSGANGSSSFTRSTTAPTNVKMHKTAPKQTSAPIHKPVHKTVHMPKQLPPHGFAKVNDPKPDTFWTICRACKMQYEYLRVYLNHNLLCPNCHEPFRAFETAPPLPKGTKRTTNGSMSVKEWLFSHQVPSSSGPDASVKITNSGRMKTGHSNVGKISSHMHRNSNHQMEGEGNAAAKREGDPKRSTHTPIEEGTVFCESPDNSKRPKFAGEFSSDNSERVIMIQTDITKSNFLSSVTAQPMPKVLMEKARKHIFKKLGEWKAESVVRCATKEVKIGHKLQKEYRRIREPFKNNCSNIRVKSVEMSNMIHVEEPRCFDSKMNTFESMSIDVPDPEFYDFDKCRSEACFEKNQVWALYDDDDGMPRYYALIRDVISVSPFKVGICWLNSIKNCELGTVRWMGSGFLNTCGTFGLGRSEFSTSLNSFSHKVKWSKGPSGTVFIHPRKRDVWVLYRNWSADWNELTADEVIHKYDVVEVMEDYDEELGVTVTPLVKVSGFRTVFHQHLDPNQTRVIPKEDIFQFSHQVPSHLLRGQEAVNAPKGCQELDPAATPSDLLQVIPDDREEETVEIDAIDGRNGSIIHLEEENEAEMVEISKASLVKSVSKQKNGSEIGEAFDVLTNPCNINL